MAAVYDTARPYAAVYVLLRRGNKAAFVLRSNTGWLDGYYGLVAGKVEKGETFLRAAVREAKEEAGVTIDPTDLRYVLTSYRPEVADNEAWVDMIFEATKWQGQVVNAEPHIHGEIAWLDLQNLPKNIGPAMRAMLRAIANDKQYLEHV